jgi:hypothetical protein
VQLAVDAQADGQLDEAELVGSLLVPADEQAPEAVARALRTLYRRALEIAQQHCLYGLATNAGPKRVVAWPRPVLRSQL